MIKTTCKDIANESVIGRSYHEINIGLLGYRVGKHIIFCQNVSNDEIEVINYRYAW